MNFIYKYIRNKVIIYIKTKIFNTPIKKLL